MDQDTQKTSNLDLLMGEEMDDSSFDSLWEEASKPMADKSGTGGDDPLLASTIGRLLDWDDLSNDKALWNELDARVAEKKQEAAAAAREKEEAEAHEKEEAAAHEKEAAAESEKTDAQASDDSKDVHEPESGTDGLTVEDEHKEDGVPKVDEASRNKILAMIGKKQAVDDGGEATANKAKEIANSMLSFDLDDDFVANYSRKGDTHTLDKADSSTKDSDDLQDNIQLDFEVDDASPLADTADMFSEIETTVVSSDKALPEVEFALENVEVSDSDDSDDAQAKASEADGPADKSEGDKQEAAEDSSEKKEAKEPVSEKKDESAKDSEQVKGKTSDSVNALISEVSSIAQDSEALERAKAAEEKPKDELKEKAADLLAMLQGAMSDVYGDEDKESEKGEHPAESEKAESEKAEEHLASHEGGAVLALDSQPENEDDEDVSGEDADGAQSMPEIRLSERARMGKVYPEGEVITSDIEVLSDVTYPAETSHKLFWVAVLLLILLIGLASFIAYRSSQGPDLTFGQKGAFQQEMGYYTHLFGTKDGLIAMCSDQNGAVDYRGQYVSGFMPQIGCESVRFSQDNKKLYFIDSEKNLYEVVLDKKESGLNPVLIANLPDMLGNEFAVASDGTVSYFKQLDMTTVGLSVLDPKTKKSTDKPLPDDALICLGMTSRQYSYISQNSIHVIVDGHETASSLDTPKLNFDRRFGPVCTANEDTTWGLLYRFEGHVVLRQGRGISGESPVDLGEDSAIRSGAKAFELIRTTSGLDLVAEDKWVHVDSRNQKTEKKLSQRLSSDFHVVASGESDKVFTGLSKGAPIEILSDGTVNMGQVGEAVTSEGVAFVNDGYSVVVLNQLADETKLNLWNLHDGSFVQSESLDVSAKALNISLSGRYGLILDDSKSYLVAWESNSVNSIGTIKTSHDIEEIESIDWSEDEQYFLIRYKDGTSELYQHSDDGGNAVSLLRSYPEGVLHAFSRNGMMWRYDSGELMFERIGDGALSVIFESLSAFLDDIDIRGIVMHPHQDDVIFWGNRGMVLMNVVDRVPKKLSSAPITWVTPDRKGTYMASSVGIIELRSGNVTPLPEELASTPLQWVGLSSYLQDQSGSFLYDARTQQIVQMFPKATGVPCIGSNCGLHATGNYVLSSRGNILTLGRFDSGADMKMRTIAAFSGKDSNNWCWISANGALQGAGDVCTTFGDKKQDIQTLGLNTEIVNAMKNDMPVTEMNKFTPASMEFKDDVNLSVTTVPEGGFAFFTVVEEDGDLPEALKFEGGVVQTPLNVKLKRDSRNFRVGVAVAGYQSRGVTFKPEKQNLSIRIPLLPEEDSGFWPVWNAIVEEGTDSKLDVDEDLDIEFKAMLYTNREALKSCMQAAKSSVISLILDEDDHFVLSGADEGLTNCLAPVINELNDQHDNQGAMPGIDDLGNIRVDVVLL